MKWLIGAVATAAVVGANVFLLTYAGNRHDPVGRLSPIARITPTKRPAQPLPAPRSTPRVHEVDD